MIAETFNGGTVSLNGMLPNGLITEENLDGIHGLCGHHSGYVITPEKAEHEFNQNIRKVLDDAHGKFCRSGNGDGGPVEEDKKYVCSSNFRDFLTKKKRGGGYNPDYPSIYAYTQLSRYGTK